MNLGDQGCLRSADKHVGCSTLAAKEVHVDGLPAAYVVLAVGGVASNTQLLRLECLVSTATRVK